MKEIKTVTETEFAHVDTQRLNTVISFLKHDTFQDPAKPFDWKCPPYLMSSDDALLSQYFFFGNAINFRFWEKPMLGEYWYPPARSSSTAMWGQLSHAVLNRDIDLFDLKNFDHMVLCKFSRVFRDPIFHHEARAQMWADLAWKLYEYWDGEALNLIKASNNVHAYIFHMRAFKAFQDPLCKLSMVNAFFHHGRGLLPFDDHLFVPIDYHIMKLLFRLGVVKVSDKIKKDLMQYQPIPENIGQELRKPCMAFFLKLQKELNLSGEIIDNKLWPIARKICTDGTWTKQRKLYEPKPNCETCPLSPICDKNTTLKTPLILTNYF